MRSHDSRQTARDRMGWNCYTRRVASFKHRNLRTDDSSGLCDNSAGHASQYHQELHSESPSDLGDHEHEYIWWICRRKWSWLLRVRTILPGWGMQGHGVLERWYRDTASVSMSTEFPGLPLRDRCKSYVCCVAIPWLWRTGSFCLIPKTSSAKLTNLLSLS